MRIETPKTPKQIPNVAGLSLFRFRQRPLIPKPSVQATTKKNLIHSLLPSLSNLKLPISLSLSLNPTKILPLSLSLYIYIYTKKKGKKKKRTIEMEQTNLPVAARRIWNIVRVMFFMLRKGISKRKLMVDLNMMMKRGKIAGKAIHNLMFHHHSAASNRRHTSYSGPREYEFSCSNSPAFSFHHHHGKRNSHFFPCAHAPPTDDDYAVTANAVKKALEMLNSEAASPAAAIPGFLQSPMVLDMIYSELSSPALPGFGRSPMVRQLRITDSPFPVPDVDEDNHVDEAAEEFILKFYNDLRKQNGKMALR